MFLQTSKAPVSHAIAQLETLENNVKGKKPAIAMLAFTAKQALKTGAVDFGKIIKMIEDMANLLKKEAEDDLVARDNCNFDLNEVASEKKDIDFAIKGLSASIEDYESSIQE